MDKDEVPRISRDGWISLPVPGGAGGVHARVRNRDGRTVITELYMHGDEITSTTVRAIPIGRIEAMANTPGATVRSREGDHTVKGPLVALAAAGLSGDVPMSELRERVPDTPEAHRSEREPLTRPDGSNPEEFSKRVARAYSEAVVMTSKPAKLLADEANVPVGTVHRWIREARQRGFLPPARKGKAG